MTYRIITCVCTVYVCTYVSLHHVTKQIKGIALNYQDILKCPYFCGGVLSLKVANHKVGFHFVLWCCSMVGSITAIV